MRLEGLIEACARHPAARARHMRLDGGVDERSFADLARSAEALADRLRAGGLTAGQVVGFKADTCLDWVVWDLATAHLGAVMRVYPAAHDIDPAEQVRRDDLALLVVEAPPADPVSHVCGLDPEALDPTAVDAAAPGMERPDLHTIVYSSGTTGREKVLLVTRSGAEAALDWFCSAFAVGPDDRHIAFLPLSGFQQRQQIYICLWQGVDLTLCGHERVMQAIRQHRPTFLLGPPALYANLLSVAQPDRPGATLADLYGGEVRFLITGMAPIRRSVLEAHWAAGLPLLEGYGLTECGIIACNTLDRRRIGAVGPPIDPDAVTLGEAGEILVRQRAPMACGYLGDDELMRATFRDDGTVMTGDIGHFDADGYLVLDGRKKDMIPLPSGRKLHPGDLELLLMQLPEVEDAVAVDNGAGVTAVLKVRAPVAERAIREGLRRLDDPLEVAGAVTAVLFSDVPLNANPLFSTANMKLNRGLVRRHFLGDA